MVKTGVAAETLSGLDKYEGMLERIYKSAPNVAGIDQGLALTKAMGMAGKDPATVSADKLISSPEFKRMAVELAKSNFKASQSAKAAEKALRKSERYKKWYSMREVKALSKVKRTSGGEGRQIARMVRDVLDDARDN